MAQSKDNIITHGLSGKLGDLLVFSQRGGKRIIKKAPKDRESQEFSPVQETHQKKFQQAILYAKGVIGNAPLKADYESKAHEGQTAYNVAVADFFHAPDIEHVDLST